VKGGKKAALGVWMQLGHLDTILSDEGHRRVTGEGVKEKREVQNRKLNMEERTFSEYN
jgi:hypothetical protein